MQNWDALQPTANYDQHNNWYNTMFAANIKTEPDTNAPSTPPGMTTSSHLEQYLKQQHQHQQQQQQHHQQQQQQTMDTLTAMTPSPGNNDSGLTHFFDNNNLQQQHLYQQQFQQAQQAAAQNQITSAHLPLGFNPLTPPGLPTAVLPPISQFYNNNNNNNNNNINTNNNVRANMQAQTMLSDNVSVESKLQAALTPRNTPPMDVTPPKSPKSMKKQQLEQQQISKMEMDRDREREPDLQSTSSEDMKYMVESEDDESIRMPIYNSHGKMKNYKCKSCGMVAITKVAFWDHARSHMKPEKILQCPKCPFVTELKHHLEYHIRKHKNLKPFQCDKCSYTCVNKSMLNSHRKSHSSVYQYRCADCDYATKYCHSFKLHLRKYEHKPGLVLDEEGLPNPSVVIDVYGTRRGPKNKSGGNGSNSHGNKRQHDTKQTPTSQLSAALQGFPHQLPASPAKSSSSHTSEVLPASKVAANHTHNMSNLLPPLATLLQQNRNMAFFPYWNLNLQMLAAQQQAAVLAQLSPRMRESALQKMQFAHDADNESNAEEDLEEREDEEKILQKYDTEDNDEQFDRKSVDSAMDLSQGTPIKDEQLPLSLQHKTQQEESRDTPLLISAGAARRKGRVLKLEPKSTTQSPDELKSEPHDALILPSTSSPLPTTATNVTNASSSLSNKPLEEVNCSTDESMEISQVNATAAVNTSSSSNVSAASSSGNSSNASTNCVSNTNSNSNSSTQHASPTAAGAIYECKYCDIFFKDAVLYTIHMGYHSCDDVFKCNMCGEKCDGPVGLFVHMARNAHS